MSDEQASNEGREGAEASSSAASPTTPASRSLVDASSDAAALQTNRAGGRCPRARASGADDRQTAFRFGTGPRGPRAPPRPVPWHLVTLVPLPGSDDLVPPPGHAFLYEIADAPAPAPPVYVGETSMPLRKRVGPHLSRALAGTHYNARFGDWAAARLRTGLPVVVRVIAAQPMGAATAAAERALVARWRALLGRALFNESAGGETRPVGARWSPEERLGRLAAIRTAARNPVLIRHRSWNAPNRAHSRATLHGLLERLVAADPTTSMRSIAREVGVPPETLAGLLSGEANEPFVDPALLAAARAAQVRRASLRAAERTARCATDATLVEAILAAPELRAVRLLLREEGTPPSRLLLRLDRSVADLGVGRVARARERLQQLQRDPAWGVTAAVRRAARTGQGDGRAADATTSPSTVLMSLPPLPHSDDGLEVPGRAAGRRAAAPRAPRHPPSPLTQGHLFA